MQVAADPSARFGNMTPETPPSLDHTDGGKTRKYHRVATVRREQDMSLKTAARRMGCKVSEVRPLEDEGNDLKLSDLLRWQRVLRVPVADLIEDPGSTPELSLPIKQRAQMLRLMKTVASIRENLKGHDKAEQYVAMLRHQLVEMMPELADVTAWHSVGQQRASDELGRSVERAINDRIFRE